MRKLLLTVVVTLAGCAPKAEPFAPEPGKPPSDRGPRVVKTWSEWLTRRPRAEEPHVAY